MCVAGPESERGQARGLCLPFEGFLEAICRVAVLKALPTDEELAEADVPHAGMYLFDLRE